MPETERWIRHLMELNDQDSKMTEKQLKILQSAIEIFSEKGYAASSTSEIAQRAGVAEGTIFRHYKTKKELLMSIVTPMMTKLIAPLILKDFTNVLESPYLKYEDFLRAVVRNRLEFARKHLAVIKIMLHEIPFHPELKSLFQELISSQVYMRIEKVVLRFQEEKQIISLPPRTVIRLTASVMIGYLFTRFLISPDYDWDDEEEIEQSVRFIMYGLSAQQTGE
ncbi:MAG: TetR/AcrR family transcriptional regulator [Paenibacillus sp.]|nr:TetR/AcrR family transcriptional regulator [Paenibacillus sp.]